VGLIPPVGFSDLARSLELPPVNFNPTRRDPDGEREPRAQGFRRKALDIWAWNGILLQPKAHGKALPKARFELYGIRRAAKRRASCGVSGYSSHEAHGPQYA